MSAAKALLAALLLLPGVTLAQPRSQPGPGPAPPQSLLISPNTFTKMNSFAGGITSASGYKQNGSTILVTRGNSGNVAGNGPQALTLVGLGAGAHLPEADYLTTAVGWHALGLSTNTNTESTAVGWNSQGAVTTGGYNTTLGVNTLGTVCTNCSHNIAIGTDAMRNGNSDNNVAIGIETLIEDVTGFNMAIGNKALRIPSTSTGTLNIAIGGQAMYGLGLTSGSNNLIIGNNAGTAITSGSNNVSLGSSTLLSTTTGLFNVAIGWEIGKSLTTGQGNVMVVACTNYDPCRNAVTTGSHNVMLGYDVTVPSPTASDQLNIASMIFGLGMDGYGPNVSTGKIGVGTAAPNATLTVGEPTGGAGAHLGFLGTAPALTSCGGSPILDTTATDAAGTITEGTSATGCVATFHAAYATAPHCVISSPNGATFTSYSVSTAALTIVNGNASGNQYTYVCAQ